MTITDETTVVLEDEGGVEEQETKTERSRDFSTFRPAHKELADYVNAHSGLTPISPNQVKALLALRTDFNNSPEVKARREERKAQIAATKVQFAGMTEAQIKAEKAARRAEAQAARLQARVAEAQAKAEALRTAQAASGEDLASAVESAQNGEDSKRPRLSRNR